MKHNELKDGWFNAYPVEGDQLIEVEVYCKKDVDEAIDELEEENRRLKRALYKALANWAHEAKFDYDDEFGLWDDMETKCLKKVEKYK